MPMHKTDALAPQIAWPHEEDAAMEEQEFRSLHEATARPILA
jgi:hypothetical protein